MTLLNLNLFVGLVASLSLYIFLSSFAVWKRLRHIPGPVGTGWSKFWLVRHQLGGRLCFDLDAACDKYGRIARISPDFVVCSDPAEIRRIWNVHSGYQRAPWYKGFRFDPNSDSILTTIENKDHHRLRTHLLPGYMGREQGNQEEVVNSQIIKFINLIERVYLSDRTATRSMEMGKVFQYLTQDVTSAVEFGKSFGYIDDNADSYGVIAALESMLVPCAMMALLPTLLAGVTSPLCKPLMPKPTDKNGVGRLLSVVHERVKERYGDKKTTNADVLQSFVQSGLNQNEVEAEALVHLLGGTDTTATALRNAIFFVATNPRTYHRLQAEIDASSATVARPIISDAEAKKLPFLQATIRETLRMWPPVSGLMPKVSAKDDTICGKAVPAGTSVACCVFGVMKDKDVFGSDADVFEPMRWLEADDLKLREMEATQGLVFAAGTRWECLGRRLAYMELGKVLYELFLRFDFSMTNPVEPFHWINQGFTLHEHMNVRITKRETNAVC